MNDINAGGGRAGWDAPAFEFRGTWREFLPIAASNLLLTLVTLGVYRFWATVRTRRYLWSRTQFIDDRLEWAGTGREMFFGFLIAIAFVLPLLLFLQFGYQALLLRGQTLLAAAGFGLSYLGLLYLFGLARFRALRYRLSRTYWHGIRGGSDDGGWRYGLSAVGKYVLAAFTIGLLVPWAMVSLWRERWGRMSFGSYAFRTAHGPKTRGLMGRFLLIYATPILFAIAIAIGTGVLSLSLPDPKNTTGIVWFALAAGAAFYVLFGLTSLAYYAAFFRKVVGELSLAGLELEFDAGAVDWFKLILGNIALVLGTLGLGLIFISYRNWSFFIRHLRARGEIDLGALTQSTTRTGSDAEGLADAFDIGAI